MFNERKYKSAWGLTALNLSLLVTGFITAEIYATLIGVIWASYFTANAASKFAGKQ